MAKKSQIERNNKKIRMAGLQKEKRDQLRKIANDIRLPDEERFEARRKLQAMPRNGAPTRPGTRCNVSGRSKAVYRKFGLSRIAFRELALEGLLPGVTKSSW